MGELVVPEADHHVRPPAHPRMHGTLAEEKAEGRIAWIGRHTPDHVTGVDVFEVDLHGVFLEIVPDGITQINADVSVFDITRSEGSWGPRDVPRIDPPSS